MESWCRTPAPSVDQMVLLRLLPLLLLVLRPAGCLSTTVAPGTLPSAAPTHASTHCAPGAPCHSGGPHVPQQSPTTEVPLTSTQMSQSPVSPTGFNSVPRGCGMSYEADPTLRDPESKARRWPWMVSVRANGTHVCAGTLIASRWVLTVAHCLTQDDVVYSVRVGSPWINQTSRTSSDAPVRQVIVNGQFRSRRYWSWVGKANDIGLLQLERPLEYSEYVWPICLPGFDYELNDHSVCTVMGWGLPRVDGSWPQFRTIQEKEVTVLNNKECDNFYHKFSKISSLIRIINSQMICAEDARREQFCYEISGEPLACPVENTWYLVGMASWGPGCKNGEAPPIYVRVSAYQPWVLDRISGQALPAPSRALLLALPLPLGLLAAR